MGKIAVITAYNETEELEQNCCVQRQTAVKREHQTIYCQRSVNIYCTPKST